MSALYLIHLWGRDARAWVPIPHPDYLRISNNGTMDCWYENQNYRDAALGLLRSAGALGACYTVADGLLAIHRCVGRFVAEFEGKHYEYEYDFGYGYSTHDAAFMFHDGNYSCDDNRSRFIRAKYPEFPEIEGCGGRIVHVKEEFALVWDDPREPFSSTKDAVAG